MRAPAAVMLSMDTKACPMCAEEIKAAAKVCKHCGHDMSGVGQLKTFADGVEVVDRIAKGVRSIRHGGRQAQQVHVHVGPVQPKKNPGIALIAAFFYGGLGHFYCGAFGRGIIFALSGPAVVALWFFGYSILFTESERLGGHPTLWTWVVLCWVLYILIHLFQMFDAYRLAEAINSRDHRKFMKQARKL